jgi:uncharacterized protein (TIGR00369 family)
MSEKSHSGLAISVICRPSPVPGTHGISNSKQQGYHGAEVSSSQDLTSSMPSSEQYAKQFLSAIRHCSVLGLSVVEASPGGATLELPYSKSIIGNPETGVIHSGALTTLMDTVLGLAVPLALEQLELCPTLDLRIDYMSAARPGESIFGKAEVYRITDNVVFARGTAFQDMPDRPIAHCVATFMRLGKHLKKSEGHP